MTSSTRRQGRWRWPGLALAAWTASGCLIPQDDVLLENVPEFRNRPPRIIEDQVKPLERVITDFGAGVCERTFEVAVEDPDVNDRIVVHWYLDYNPQDPRGPYRHFVLANTDGSPLRTDRGTLLISLSSANSPLGTPGTHLVEAIVSDSELVNREPQSRLVQLPDGGVVENPGFAVSYTWVVNTVQGDCR